MEKILLDLINERKVIDFNGIIKSLNISDEKTDNIKDILTNQELLGQIYCDSNGLYSSFPHNYKIGKVFMTKTNKAFVRFNNKSIPMNESTNLLNGDTIIVEITGVKKPKAEFKKLLKREKNIIVGEVKEEKGIKYLVSYNNDNFKIDIDSKTLDSYISGDRVLIELGTKNEIIDYVGFKSDPDTEMKSIALNHGFHTEFSKECINEANNLPTFVSNDDIKNRKDLRNENIFTIDSTKTKDMDDALSIKLLDNGNYELSVHIADVSHYIKPNMNLFKEASFRGTSIYPVNKVIPMLPKIISNGICSLNEGKDRLTKTIQMEIDKNGNVVNYKIYNSVINSKKKMSYEELNEMFESNNIKDDYKPYWDDINLLRNLNKILAKANYEKGALEFDDNELKMEFDENDNVKDINFSKRGEAELIIANAMILANEKIAEYVSKLSLPFVYRNHEAPNNENINSIIEYFISLGYGLKKLQSSTDPKNLQKIVSILKHREEFPILSNLILRGLEKADYGTLNIGHYGLALRNYTHFTSPIRRFPDLMVHTLLDKYEEKKGYTESELKELENILQNEAVNSSYQERNADDVERTIQKQKIIDYVDNNIGKEFDARITAISDKYMRVITSNGIDGIIWFKDLFDDKYTFNPRTNYLV